MLRKFLAALGLFTALLTTAPAAAQTVLTPSWVAVYGKQLAAAPVTLALISSVNTTFPAAATDSGCWSGQWRTGSPSVANPDGGSPTLLPVVRTGYNTSASPTTYNVNLVITAQVRQVYPNQGTPTASTVALSDYVTPTDSISGVDTSACDRIPTPVANWATPHRQVVGNTLSGVEVLAFSRDAQSGSEVAAVQCSATDGTLTVSGVVSTMTVSGRPDANPVIDYACPSLNITTLAAGLITVNAKVYPWYGDVNSVADSSLASATDANLRTFSPRYFWKNTSAPFAVFVCQQAVASSCAGAGVDASCVVSTTLATAYGSPCLTFQGAMNKLKTNGAIDNAIIYISSNTGTPPAFAGPSTTQMTQNGGCLVVTRDPQVTRANAILTFGNTTGPAIYTVTNPTGTGCIRFYDMTMKRTQGNSLFGNATNPLEIIWDTLNIDNGTFTGSWLSGTAHSNDYIYNANITNPGVNFLSAIVGAQHRIIRGLTSNLASPGTLELTTIVGNTSTIAGGNIIVPNGLTADGAILAFNKFLGATLSGFGNTTSNIPNGMAYVQNVTEDISATASITNVSVSNDSATNPTNNVIYQYNTLIGAFIAGRNNLFYDDTVGTARVNKFQSFRGNIHGEINTKGDVFLTDGTHVGNWGYLYGVGEQGEWSQYIDANSAGLGSSFAQVYPGLGASISASATTALMLQSKFTSYQGVTCVTPGSSCATFTAGAGGGDYSLTSGAGVKATVAKAMLPFDLAGTARPTTADTAGAYVAP